MPTVVIKVLKLWFYNLCVEETERGGDLSGSNGKHGRKNHC